MGRIEGIGDYQSILAGLGILLFLVQLFILVYYVLHNRPLKYVLPSLIFPIVMIGFPAIKKFQFGNNVIEMQEQIAALEENPEDTEARAELEERLEQLEESENLQPSTLVTLARAHAAKGDTAAAVAYVDSALELEPELKVSEQDWVKLVKKQHEKKKKP